MTLSNQKTDECVIESKAHSLKQQVNRFQAQSKQDPRGLFAGSRSFSFSVTVEKCNCPKKQRE